MLQNAIDIFGDRWASKIEEVCPGQTSGPGPYLGEDPRPSIAAQYLGFEPGSLQGMNILELGPLEGARTYQLAKLGADRILAIEANAEAFLKIKGTLFTSTDAKDAHGRFGGP